MKWITRKQTYVKLVQETLDLGGILGKPDAAGDGAIASGRAETLDRDPLTDTGQLRRLDRLFSHIDERVCEAVEHGIKECLYFLRVPFPRVDDRSPGVVKGPRHRYLPITSPVQTDLLAIVRQDLRPAPIKPTAPKGAAQIRIDFEAALRRRPGDSGPSVAM